MNNPWTKTTFQHRPLLWVLRVVVVLGFDCSIFSFTKSNFSRWSKVRSAIWQAIFLWIHIRCIIPLTVSLRCASTWAYVNVSQTNVWKMFLGNNYFFIRGHSIKLYSQLLFCITMNLRLKKLGRNNFDRNDFVTRKDLLRQAKIQYKGVLT